MDQDIIKNARARVSSLFGEKLASKASTGFCLTFGQPTAFAASEAMVQSVKPQSIVLEFAPQPEVSAEVNNAVEQMRKTRTWTSLRNTLKRIELAAVTRGGVTEVMETGRSEPEILPV